jgi:hypothetical protein
LRENRAHDAWIPRLPEATTAPSVTPMEPMVFIGLSLILFLVSLSLTITGHQH